MKDKTFQIIDESNDRKYFTILPNIILNHSNGDEQSLYSQMKRFAGEDGKCFATQDTLANQLGWGGKYPDRKKVRRNIQKLLKRKWIKKAGTFKGKTRPINAYKIVDLWQLNIDYYSKKKWDNNTHISRTSKGNEEILPISNGSIIPPEEEPIKKKNQSLMKKKDLDSLKDSNQRKDSFSKKPNTRSLSLSRLLYKLIKKDDPRHPQPNWDVWTDDMDKINRIDKRPFKQIEEMIEWARRDNFWLGVIVSPAALRKNFNQLVGRSKSDSIGNVPGVKVYEDDSDVKGLKIKGSPSLLKTYMDDSKTCSHIPYFWDQRMHLKDGNWFVGKEWKEFMGDPKNDIEWRPK